MNVQKEVVFGDDGMEISAADVNPEVAEQAEEVSPEVDETPAPAAAAEVGKYKIGDKFFATMQEALAYAESQEAQVSAADAYRQGMRDALASQPVPQSAAAIPEPEELNAEELYTNPDAYLRKRDERIKTEVLNQINSKQVQEEADARVWREFTDRHPELVEFREEITALAGRIQPEIAAVSRTKGQPAAYDFVATKFKAQVERQASVLKPKRELRNGAQSNPTGGKVETVTPKAPPKKASTMREQMLSIRKGR